MERDEFLKEILANGVEQPSANFTDKVMKRLAKESVKQEQRVEMPSLIVWLSILFPILALTASLKPVYNQLSVMLKAVGLENIITQQTIVILAAAILLFSLLDVFLIRWFVKKEHSAHFKMFLSLW
jgi:hypothetical protein